MRRLDFLKMHGMGNDFVIVDVRRAPIALSPEQIRWLGDRHRGVGFDQLALISNDGEAGAFVRFYNPDGGEAPAEACGNATRCVADLLGRELGTDEILLRTTAGRLPARLLDDGRVRVEMTEPLLDWSEIPLARACDTLDVPLDHPELANPVAVNMGNPHAVFFVDDVDAMDVEGLGAALERHPMFPERANIGFATVRGRSAMRLRVFERSAGLTLACGSGACAAHVAAWRRGLVEPVTTLDLDGGQIDIEWAGAGPVVMTGPVAYGFRGTVDFDRIGI